MADGMIEVARATVTLVPNMAGSQGEITSQLTGVARQASQEAGNESGRSFGDSFANALGASAAAISAALAAATAFSAAVCFGSSGIAMLPVPCSASPLFGTKNQNGVGNN